jgi:hypothetical protein
MEQINSFHYLGSLISYENEVAFDNKLNNYLKILATICSDHRKHFKKSKKTIHALVFQAWLYGSEDWTIKARDVR